MNTQKPRVVVTGSTGAVGRQVCSRLAEEGYHVLGLDRRSGISLNPEVTLQTVDLAVADLRALLTGADIVVHLASGVQAHDVEEDPGHNMLAVAERLLAAADTAGVTHFVIRSSAMVYGAWEDNPVPLTEDAEIRPCPGFRFAEHRAALEKIAREWAEKNKKRSVSVLRTAVTVGEERPGGLARVLESAKNIRTEEGDPMGQFLHADDLAEAVICVVKNNFDGPINVAPDGWMSSALLAELSGPVPRIRVPAFIARLAASIRWQIGLTDAPASIVPYTIYPWIISNDRIKELGWEAQHTNEEAYVVGYEPKLSDQLNAGSRQRLAFIATAIIVGFVISGIVRTFREPK